MAESLDLLAEIAAMRNQLDDVSAVTAALLRTGGGKAKAEILAFLEKDEAARVIFLMCNGETTQATIVEELKKRGVSGGSAPAVSRKLEKLFNEYHLVAPDHRRQRSKVYRRTTIATALHIERELNKMNLSL